MIEAISADRKRRGDRLLDVGAAPNGSHFDKVGVTLRVTKAAERGRWHSSLGE